MPSPPSPRAVIPTRKSPPPPNRLLFFSFLSSRCLSAPLCLLPPPFQSSLCLSPQPACSWCKQSESADEPAAHWLPSLRLLYPPHASSIHPPTPSSRLNTPETLKADTICNGLETKEEEAAWLNRAGCRSWPVGTQGLREGKKEKERKETSCSPPPLPPPSRFLALGPERGGRGATPLVLCWRQTMREGGNKGEQSWPRENGLNVNLRARARVCVYIYSRALG